ncbi:hypothetical protein M3U23_15740 [Xanthomonas sp. PPL129]
MKRSALNQAYEDLKISLKDQAPVFMKDDAVLHRIAFLSRLRAAHSRPASFTRAVWDNRRSLLHWILLIIAAGLLFGYTLGPSCIPNVVAVAAGVLLGFAHNLHQAVKTWPLLSSVIDWAKVEREISADSSNGS